MRDLDLEPILIKVMDDEGGYRWTFDFACRVAQEYRRFLILCLEHPQDVIVPSKIIDNFWHLHILDTQKYIEDCEHCFGSMLHHFPYFGMRGSKDAVNLYKAWLKTLALYQSTFGGTAAPAELWPYSRRLGIGIRCQGGEDANPAHGAFDRRRPRLADLRDDVRLKSQLKERLERGCLWPFGVILLIVLLVILVNYSGSGIVSVIFLPVIFLVLLGIVSTNNGNVDDKPQPKDKDEEEGWGGCGGGGGC